MVEDGNRSKMINAEKIYLLLLSVPQFSLMLVAG